MNEANHLADTCDLREKINRLELLLAEIEADLNETLGIHQEESENPGEVDGDDYVSRFADVLAYLQNQEHLSMKAPLERWKAIQMKDVVDLDQLELAQLLGLYRTYLASDEPRDDYEIDDEFEQLIEHRWMLLERFFQEHPNQWYPIRALLEGLSDRKNAIATFLILLDMVFRKILIMKEDRKTVAFRKNEFPEQDPVPD